MSRTLSVHGHADATTVVQNMIRVSQDVARIALAGQAAVTDSSTGVAAASPFPVVGANANLVDVAVGGTIGVDKTTLDAALATHRNALRTLVEKAKALAAVLGVPHPVTDSSGGTDGAGTVAAVTKATAAATVTAPTSASINTIFQAIDNHLYLLARLVNKLCVATGTPKLVLTTINSYSYTAWPATDVVAAYGVTSGVAGANGATKVAVDAKLSQLANDYATVAARLNLIRGGIAAGNNQLVIVE